MLLQLKAEQGSIPPGDSLSPQAGCLRGDATLANLLRGQLFGTVPMAGSCAWIPPTGASCGPAKPAAISDWLIHDGEWPDPGDERLRKLHLIEADPAAYKQLAGAQVLDGPESWGPLALAHGRLIARDLNKMVCLDVGALNCP